MSRLGRREAWARTGQREGNRQETGSWRHQNQKRSLGCILHTGGCLWEGWCFYFLGDFLKLWYNVYNVKFTIVTVFHCRFRDIKYVPILGQPAPLFPFGALSSCKTESLSLRTCPAPGNRLSAFRLCESDSRRPLVEVKSHTIWFSLCFN